MDWTDLDKTPLYIPPTAHGPGVAAYEQALCAVFEASEDEVDGVLDRFTPSMPLPLVRRTVERDAAGDVVWPESFRPAPMQSVRPPRPTWEPPPLRKLLESTPPAPRAPMRSDLELACALPTDDAAYGLSWKAPALATTSTLVIDWDTAPKPRRRHLGWIAVGAAYAFGITTMVAVERDRQLSQASAHARELVDLPALTKSSPQADQPATMTPIELKEPLRIVGFVTDPPAAPLHEPTLDEPTLDEPTPQTVAPVRHVAQEIDLARLKVIVGGAASQAASCGDGETFGAARVGITFAPTGRATGATLMSGPFGGTRVGHCITEVMRRTRIAPFAGGPTTVTKTVTISKPRE